MRLYNKHISLLLSLCALSACSEDDVIKEEPIVPDSEKSPIELSVGGVDTPASATRAVVTDGTTDTNFGRDTKVFILMKSDKEVDNDGVVSHNGYEYKGDRASTLYTVSRGDVVHETDPNKIVFDNVNQKYWDDAHARSSQLTMWAVAQKVARPTVDGTWKNITFQQLSGDKANPSISDSQNAGYKTTVRNEWQSTEVYPAIFSWSVGNLSNAHQNQDAYTIIYQDLLFSNNVADYTGDEWITKIPDASKTDNRVKFNFSTHKFPASTELKFYHAMSKITIQIKAGEGFKVDGTDFNLANGTIDKLSGINTRGLFNIKDGEFQMIHDRTPITIIPCSEPNTGNNPYYTLEALAIPNIHEFLSSNHSLSDVGSRFVLNKKDLSTDVMMEFTIDNNKYQITSGQLFDALSTFDSDGVHTGVVTNATKKTDNDTYIPLEAGKNYVFTFTIGKTKIKNITAQVVGWEDVVATPQTPSNARITLKVEERGDVQTSGVSLYRAKDAESPTYPTDTYKGYKWDVGYANMNATYSETNSRWETNLFWDNNADYYHFRALSPTDQTINTATNQPDNIPLTSSSCTNANSYNQLAWGAPFMDDDFDDDPEDFKFTYDRTNGFDVNRTSGGESVKQIYHAIGATEDPIKLIMFHMMSGVHFTIKTTGSADSNTDKVELYRAASGSDPAKRTKVELIGYYSTGKVLLGTGYVGVTGTNTSATEISFASATDNGAYTNQEYFYSAVPQSLENVELVITTPDNNQYKVALKNVTATSVSSNNVSVSYTDSKLDFWYPGFKYNYTLTLKKTGITDLKATIVEWEEISADQHVQIK